jgi:hypothetical protein
MTEAEWRACDDPEEMLSQLGRGASPRKYRMFAAACCRRLSDVWKVPADSAQRRAIEIAELHADGLVPYEEKRAVLDSLGTPGRSDAAGDAYRYLVKGGCVSVAKGTSRSVRQIGNDLLWVQRGRTGPRRPNRDRETSAVARRAASDFEGSQQASLLRDIFGPTSFRPITIDETWRTPDVLALARGIYDERAFDLMPILGDALEDAGCSDADLLAHCRSTAEHVRGCWAVDALLGKG